MTDFNFFAQLRVPGELGLLIFVGLIVAGVVLFYFFRDRIKDALGFTAAKKTILEQEIEQR